MPGEQHTISLDALALYYKRKYERECEESLSLAGALRDAHQKNTELVNIATQLQNQLKLINGEPELPLTGEVIPPPQVN